MGTFYVCYYHVVWATKYRMPLITPQIEKLIFYSIEKKSEQLKCPIHIMNTVADHIHIAVTIPPSKAVWEWIRDTKGITAHNINSEFPNQDEVFKWQKGYGVLTFGKKTLPYISDYIAKQKEHHASNTVEPYLEYIPD
ncbi:MAG: IS200/IS605 family transposase [Phototrophicaceae bacterium]